MKISIKNLLLLIVLIVVSLKFHKEELNQFPKHIHAWAQSDYYALSLGFIDNEFDFFHPQTYIQNSQFPDKYQTPKNNSITAADFPIHTFNVALLMKLTGSEEPRAFRTYTLLFSVLGLFVLFLLVKELNGSDVKAFFVVAIVLLSPVYIYYRAGFLPSIPALTTVIIAYYFYIKYLKTTRFRFFNWSILFFTLAALTRTPFAIFLIAVFCQEVLTVLRKKKMNFRILISISLSFAVIIGYFIYNSVLRSKYGSIFLSQPLIPSSWLEAKTLIKTSLNNWKFHYLTYWHYLFIVAVVSLSLVLLLRRQKMDELHQKIILNTGIALLGAILYSILMLKQFEAHDYYFIDTFFTPFILFTAVSITYIQFKNLYLNLVAFGFLAFAVNGMYTDSFATQVQRKQTSASDSILFTILNYNGGEEFLNSLNISKEAKLLVMDSNAPNIPFILLNRKGYTVHSLTKKNIEDKLEWDYDYLVMQDQNAQYILETIYPELKNLIERVGGNSAFSIYKKTKFPKNKSVEELLGLTKRTPFYVNSIRKDNNWRNKLFVGDSLITITPKDEFGLTLETYNLSQLINKNSSIVVRLKTANKEAFKGASLIFSITADDQTITYQERKLSVGQENYLFTTTPISSLDHKVSLYIWNSQQETILVQDFSVKMY